MLPDNADFRGVRVGDFEAMAEPVRHGVTQHQDSRRRLGFSLGLGFFRCRSFGVIRGWASLLWRCPLMARCRPLQRALLKPIIGVALSAILEGKAIVKKLRDGRSLRDG